MMKPFTPAVGATYKLRSGGEWICEKVLWGDAAVMRNLSSGWTCVCHHVYREEDGCILWSYSSGGHFRDGQPTALASGGLVMKGR